MSSDPKADPATIRRALELMIDAEAVHGFVALKLKAQRGEAQDGGYYDRAHLAALVKQAVYYSGKAESVCITLNPVKPARGAVAPGQPCLMRCVLMLRFLSESPPKAKPDELNAAMKPSSNGPPGTVA